MANLPVISIVTPSYNQAAYIEETIDSILSQGYPNLEYVIIDGGSTDGSKDIIKKYSNHLKYWVSEADNGQSDAINKGIEKLSGDVFNWVNSDDLLLPGSLKMVGEIFTDQNVSCVKGNAKHIIGNEIIDFNVNISPRNQELLFCDPIINQQSTFFRLDFVKDMRGVNPLLHYSMDYELWIKYLITNGTKQLKFSQEFLSGFRLHEAAKTSLAEEIFRNDIANILLSIAELKNADELSSLLGMIYDRYESYSIGIDVDKMPNQLIENMVLYFIIKWHRFPNSKKEMSAIQRLKDKFDLSTVGAPESWIMEFESNFTFKNRVKRVFSRPK